MKTKRPGTDIVPRIYLLQYIVIGNFRPTLLAVLRIQDVEPVRYPDFFTSRIQDPSSWKYFFEKLEKLGLDPGFGIRVPGSKKNVSRILDPDPLVKKKLYPGSRVWISSSAYLYGMVSNTPYGTSFNAFKNSATSKQTISIRDDSNCIDLGYSVADPGGLSRI
jgi:hypothetical protein